MSAPTIQVVPVDVMAAGDWRWQDAGPMWRAPGSAWSPAARFDPFPAYRHDLEVAQETARAVADTCPPRWDVVAYLADREAAERTNGWSDMWIERNPDVEGRRVGHGFILMSGKRIPPHPALTRYLVAHEYGHQVQWMLADARGASDARDEQIVETYAAVRGLPLPTHHGSGGRWHDSAAEVFADDFRIVACGIEVEYWPHPGIERPDARVREWWEAALDDLRAPMRDVAA